MIIVYTVATHDILPFKNWCLTAQKLGYEYRVLGMNEEWKGWSWRTSKYLEALKFNTNNDPIDCIYVLLDSSDIFFVRPANYKNFKKKFYQILDKHKSKFPTQNYLDVVVSAEHNCTGFDNQKIIFNTLNKNMNYPDNWIYKYPNAGSIVGTKQGLISLLESNLNSANDQDGLYDKFCNNTLKYCLDYKQQLGGTIIEKSGFSSKSKIDELKLWDIDNIKNCIQSTISNQNPYWVHFPGSSRNYYNLFLKQLHPTLKQLSIDVYFLQEYRKSNTIFYFALIIIIIILIVLIYYYYKKNKN